MSTNDPVPLGLPRTTAQDRPQSSASGSGEPGRGRSSEAPPEAGIADALLSQVATGDEEAFGAFYDAVAPGVYGVIVSIVRNPALAQEVTQEVFLEAWRTADRFDPVRGSARSWLLTMARRRAVDHVRSAQSASHRDVVVGARHATPDYDVVSDVVETRLAHQHVRRCLQGLTSLQRQAIILAFYEGHTHREVSQVLAVPLGTVKARLRDGLIRLRDCLGAW